MSTGVIYTASDLDRKRREVTNAARRGLAHIRDTDGTGLVLLRASYPDGAHGDPHRVVFIRSINLSSH